MKIAKLNTLLQPVRLTRDRRTGKVVKVAAFKKAFVTLSEPEMINVPEPPKRRQPVAPAPTTQ